ncbi:MAG: hypothetical protein R3C03_04440, partial [Pirellulaceae bacterium]
MDFLNQFFENVFQQSETFKPEASAKARDKAAQDLARHLEQAFYGEFELTDAVRPGMGLEVRPMQGYRHDVYVDEESGAKVPVIMAAASREILFSTFMQLVGRLGQAVDVVLETSHNHDTNGHVDLYRE